MQTGSGAAAVARQRSKVPDTDAMAVACWSQQCAACAAFAGAVNTCFDPAGRVKVRPGATGTRRGQAALAFEKRYIVHCSRQAAQMAGSSVHDRPTRPKHPRKPKAAPQVCAIGHVHKSRLACHTVCA